MNMKRIAAIQAFGVYPLMAALYIVLMVANIAQGDALGAAARSDRKGEQ